MEKSQVRYRPAANPISTCTQCCYKQVGLFQTTGTCALISGEISDGYVCDYFRGN